MGVSINIAIAQNSQSVANNTSNVTVTLTASWTYGSWNHIGDANGWLTIDGTKYTFSNVILNPSKTTSGSQTLITKTLDISHNSDGTKTLSCSASFDTGLNSTGTVTASASKTLTTIPRKSSLSASNGTLGASHTLTINRESSSFTHTITYKCGSASGTICTKTSATNVAWSPPLSLSSQNTTGTTVSITFTLYTYTGDGTLVGDNSYTKTFSMPSSVKPSCSIAVSDPTGYADTYGGYVKGLSKFKVVVTATTSYGSAIASYGATANGSKYTASSFTTGVLTSSGELTISATVTDKRGRTGSASVSVTVSDYSAPKITALSVHRCDADGSANDQGAYVKVTFSGSVTSLSNKNTANYTLEYKKTSDSGYTSIALTDLQNTYSVGDFTYIFSADTGSSYNVRLSIADNFATVNSTTSASTAFTLMHWLASGLGMAIGKVAELTNVLDIAFQTRFLGGILHPVLEPETDLNDVLTPNVYVGKNVSTNNYANCPITSGTFSLEVIGMGDSGQVKQRLSYCHKSASITLERIYYSSEWGKWYCVSSYAWKVLWSGSYYMTADHVVSLAEPITKQKSGIELVFSPYVDGAAVNANFQHHFVSKAFTSGHGHDFFLSNSTFGKVGSKYLIINDETITGSEWNDDSGTGESGIVYNNKYWVLRYVIGV